MTQMQPELILWTGQKHSGKTTAAAELAKIARSKGFVVSGLLAPSLYRNGRLIGFDALDLHTGKRASLAKHKTKEERPEYLAPPFRWDFIFIEEGLKLGHLALSPTATQSADLVIVDEFGPLELENRGWRKNVDSLLALNDALILLVVRQELKDSVKKLYEDIAGIELKANKKDSIDRVIKLLKKRSAALNVK